MSHIMIAFIYPTMSRKAPPNKTTKAGIIPTMSQMLFQMLVPISIYLIITATLLFYHPCFTEAKTKL